ncbi:DnaK-like protein [uncultured Desulfobacterium sp.]|uniref:DnaK-like protein n=1 Tax=uncultured Desulfobacterium sp. TaxID=201089 RepID=A0A445MX74_9BACT|nr:DnaK-like protein [uncultured Desulfobacterium sp.]
MSEPRYIIGIDLGTTNSVVAFTEAVSDEEKGQEIRIFMIPQLVGPGSVAERETLPSSVLLPGPHDVPDGGLVVPWNRDQTLAVGEFARDRGAEIPHRLISSSKSWLCHTGVDRKSPILPWEGEKDGKRLSPVEASAAILRHIKESWNHAMAREHEDFLLERQDIVLTVPASFDVVARNLTVEAANMAGLSDITLLEEPQAAFYAWIEGSQGKWRKKISVGDVVLVVDVGGGTSDFSLIRVMEDKGDLSLERIAVGEHVLVGGDNMDLTLAYTIARRMASKGQKLSAYQMRGLCHGCRAAKEQLFANSEMVSYPIAILGRGSSLIGGAIKTELTHQEVEEVLTNGFFPKCNLDSQPQAERRSGMRELGLVYSSDPSITRHLARFLYQQKVADNSRTFPTAVIFNGGVMKARGLRKRVLDVLSLWMDNQDQNSPREIEGQSLDLAVARGAAYYGLARRGKGIRIRGGLSRTYYIGIEAALPAVPGMPAPVKALCVAPFGMEEGTEATLPEKEFGLVVGEPVKFDFLGSHIRRHDTIGAVIEDWEGEIEEVTTLETNIEGEAGAVIPVTLRINATEVGALEIWCDSTTDDRKFKLEFNVRERNLGSP